MGITRMEDQASGLRRLFGGQAGPGWPALHALCCPARPALALPLVQTLAHEWSAQGQCLAWIDELDAAQREDWPWPCRIRYDLSQSMMDHVPLSASLCALDDRLWYAGARHMQRVLMDRGWPLGRRLFDSGVDFDAVFVSVAPASERLWSVYGQRIHHTVISGCTRPEIDAALAWMTGVPAAGVASWRLLLAGPQADQGGDLQALVDSGSAVLGQPLQVLGPVLASWQDAGLHHALSDIDAMRRVLIERLLQD